MKHHLTFPSTTGPLATSLITRLAFTLLAVAVIVGCSSSDEPAAVSEVTTPVNATSTTAAAGFLNDTEATEVTEQPAPIDVVASAAEVLAEGVVLEAHDMVVESSGVQMRVERIEQRAGATLVRLAITNGADEDKQVPYHDVATLTLPDGTTYEPIAAFPTRGMELATGESSIVVLAYPPTSGRFDLEVGIDGLATDQFSRQVGFEFDDLDPAIVVSGLQLDAPLAGVGTHPNGSQIELDGIRFTPDRIGVGLNFRNGADDELWLFGAFDTYLEDDLGNRHRALVKPNGRSFFELDPESSLSGVLTFAGRMDPRATSFSILVNDGGLLTNPVANSPAFALGPFDLASEQTVDVPLDVDLNVTIDRSIGPTATLSAFRFDEDTIRAQVTIINEGDEVADFNRGLTYVVDSEGIVYKSQIAELPELVLSPGEGFEGEIVFSGRLQPAATSLRLTVNHGGLLQDNFFFDPVEVVRSSRSAVLSDFEVTDWSAFTTAALDTSSIAEIAVAIAEFDGVEVDGGVLLTLPETILFDFGESALRSDAKTSIALVSEILDYYEGDQVLVVGHTDSVGDDASNIALSDARANAVLAGLVAEGVSLDLLSIDGRGESEPVAPNQQADGSDDPEGRQQNRRVEIFIETTRGIPEG